MHESRVRHRGVDDPGPAERLYAPRGSGTLNKAGYRVIYDMDGRQVREHRVIMEQVLGRKLRSFEDVHHKNGHRADNRPGNLELWVRSPGQRLTDLLEFIAEHYPAEMGARLQAIQ
jgi:hypothetical protein